MSIFYLSFVESVVIQVLSVGSYMTISPHVAPHVVLQRRTCEINLVKPHPTYLFENEETLSSTTNIRHVVVKEAAWFGITKKK